MMLNLNAYDTDLGSTHNISVSTGKRRVLSLNSSAAVRAWVDKYNGVFSRSSTMMVPDKDGVYQVTPMDTPAIYHGEWNGSQWLAAQGSGLAVWPSVTNAMPAGKYRDPSAWSIATGLAAQNRTGIDGQPDKAWTLTDNSTSGGMYFGEYTPVPDNTGWVSQSCFIGKDDDETRQPFAGLKLVGGTAELDIGLRLNTKTGVPTQVVQSDGAWYQINSRGDFWEVMMALQNNATGNTSAHTRVYPAASSNGTTYDDTATGAIVFDWAQLFTGSARPCIYPVPGGETLAAQSFGFENRKLVSNTQGAVYAEARLLPDDYALSWGRIVGINVNEIAILRASKDKDTVLAADNSNHIIISDAFAGHSKVAVSWKDATTRVFAGGRSVYGAYDGDWHDASTDGKLYIGYDGRGATNLFNGVIHKVVFDYEKPRTTEFWEGQTL